MHIPWWFYALLAIDPIVIGITGFILMKKIRKVVESLQTVAESAVGGAAETVREEIIKLLPHRPTMSKEGRRAMGVLGALYGVSADDLKHLEREDATRRSI